MSSILLIRSVDDLLDAVEQVNHFLVHRREHLPKSHETDQILGIWLRPELDADFQTWLMLERTIDRGRFSANGAERSLSPLEAGLSIRESVSFSQLWALCQLDGKLLFMAESAAERRCKILDHFLRARSASQFLGDEPMFFAVLTLYEAGPSSKPTMRRLQDSYPGIVGKTWFIDDPESGLRAAPLEDDA